MPKKYSSEEIEILKRMDGDNKFNEMEIMQLQNGDAPIKLQYKVDRLLEANAQFWKHSMSRAEAKEKLSHYLTRLEFVGFLHHEFSPRINLNTAVLDLLIDKGILTEEEIKEKLKKMLEANKPHEKQENGIKAEGSEG